MTDSAVFGSDRGEDRLITACTRCRRWRIGYIENKCDLPKIDFNFVDGRKTQHLEDQYIKSKSVSFLVNYNSSASNSAKLIFLWSSVAAGDEEEITDSHWKVKFEHYKWKSSNWFAVFWAIILERKQILTFLLIMVVVLTKGNFGTAVVVAD